MQTKQKIIRVATINATVNPKGVLLKPDANGYYDVNLGALNVENTSGEFYAAGPGVLKLFTDPSSFAVKKCNEKELYGEYDHPVMTPDIKAIINTPKGKRAWIDRQFELRPDRLSHHIKSFSVYETDVRDPQSGTFKYLVRGLVKPYGPYKQEVQDALTNPDIAAAFSLRSLVIEDVVNGRIVKTLTYVLTWDSVLTPGIRGSTDQATLGFEMGDWDIQAVISEIEDEYSLMTATESDKAMHKNTMELLGHLQEAVKQNDGSPISLLNDWK